MTQVMVTGATGFIGQWLCVELTKNGHDVYALLRRPDQLEDLRRACTRRGGNGASIHEVSGNLDAPDLALESDPLVDIIFHLGAKFAWNLTPAEARATNVRGGSAVVDLAARIGAKLVIVGGFMSQNPQHLGELRIDPLDPLATDWDYVYRKAGAYEASKLESFFAMADRAESLSVPWIGVHPAAVAGHSRTGDIAAGQPFAELIDGVRSGRMAAIPGGTDHWLPLVAVDHLAKILAALADRQWPTETALITLDPETPDLATMVGLIADSVGVSVPRRRIPLGLLRAVLRLPGGERLAQTSRESLEFLKTERYDVSATQAFAAAAGIETPSIRDVIVNTAAQAVRVTASVG
ncbi:SDR family oxidoreductase [Antrihabitans sp. NCIMB 15449]|uniref:SDR family oxidoreductase n=1 Tax=Antrihabitans spumae TaxID=3373370 RepID=A0ABW7JW77_9NOCA